jgi:hypothetical protein|mmetsp:Transcript_5268/g.9263  ORF Transcript_5268/g.9263 Transcript_5268/m.9263 type:complete len:99 (+) Transcript_5268:141-437(+)
MGNPLSDLGLISGTDEILNLDHRLVFSVSSSMEEAMRRTLLALEHTSRDTARTLRLVGYAAATYLVLTGLSNLVASLSSSSSRRKSLDNNRPANDDTK